jgi:hypothetical protein
MRILMVGDTHCNAVWLGNVVFTAAEQLRVDAICQLGDFGYWPHSDRGFLDEARSAPVPFFFVDGNHEHHEALQADTRLVRAELALDDVDPVPFGGNLWYLPRGARLTWGGVRVAALGGARSIDRAHRTPGHDWFLEEAVTDADLARLGAGGCADILLTHDAPFTARLPLSPRHQLPAAQQMELSACEDHRRRIDEALDAVQPAWLFHGHYHRRWQLEVQRPWGKTTVVGLSEDGSDIAGNLALVTCVDGTVDVRNLYTVDGVEVP